MIRVRTFMDENGALSVDVRVPGKYHPDILRDLVNQALALHSIPAEIQPEDPEEGTA